MSELACMRCDIFVDDPIIERIDLPNDRFHLKASCPKCGRYIKFISPEPNAPAVFHFGKLKGLNAVEAWAKDASYCRWALESGAAKGRLARELNNLISEMER